jgi:hypothetical protein
VFCVAFDVNQTTYSTTAEKTGTEIAIFGGETSAMGEPRDPLSIYKRGLWFDGNDNFVTIEGLILNTSFAVKVWVRSTAPGAVFTINKPDHTRNNAENFLAWYFGATDLSSRLYLANGRQSINDSKFNPGGDLNADWVFIAICLTYRDAEQ